jgi:hypothetical protein
VRQVVVPTSVGIAARIHNRMLAEASTTNRTATA